MCAHCDEDVDVIRPIVDAVIDGERHQRTLYARHTKGQHAIRLANTILDAHQDDDGGMGADDVKSMALEYALTVQKLVALQEVSGL